ncbi:MAG: HAD family hydrolase [Peptococcaceae bacterium]|nr:HAD family hydrolase [Peptococcaceae bacterium]
MSDRKLLLFDCMETLIDMVEIPGEKEYALWAFEGSGVENCWQGQNHFREHYQATRKKLRETPPFDKEYSIYERFKMIVEITQGKDKDKKTEEIVTKLVSNYWAKYKAKCFVKNEVRDTLDKLSKQHDLGVVSNFIVEQGVEELLAEFGLQKYFRFVVTSVSQGWRKPHPLIYQAALSAAQAAASNHVIFIGDDYINDYITPRKLGMGSLLYDPTQKYLQINDRITSFIEIPEKILGF